MSNTNLNRWEFSKSLVSETVLKLADRELHAAGLEKEKARSPDTVHRRGVTSHVISVLCKFSTMMPFQHFTVFHVFSCHLL